MPKEGALKEGNGKCTLLDLVTLNWVPAILDSVKCCPESHSRPWT